MKLKDEEKRITYPVSLSELERKEIENNAKKRRLNFSSYIRERCIHEVKEDDN